MAYRKLGVDNKHRRSMLANLTREVLNSINYNMIVTPKEIDFLIDNLCEVISSGINKSLHSEMNNKKKDD